MSLPADTTGKSPTSCGWPDCGCGTSMSAQDICGQERPTTQQERMLLYNEIAWRSSRQYFEAREQWLEAQQHWPFEDLDFPDFEQSQWFRDARHHYRKRINHSWDKEST